MMTIKKVLLSGALMGIAVLGVAGPASASVHWNVKCAKQVKLLRVTGTKLVLRPGDCARTLKPGQEWVFPKGVIAVLFARTTGSHRQLFPPTVESPPNSSNTFLESIAPGHYGTEFLAPSHRPNVLETVWVKAQRPLLVVASFKPFAAPKKRVQTRSR